MINLKKLTLGSILATIAWSGFSQAVPPSLIDNLKVTQIAKWEVKTVDSHYVVNMTLTFENAGDLTVLLKNPEMMVSVSEAKQTAEVLGTGEAGGVLYKGTNTPKPAMKYQLGTARLKADTENSGADSILRCESRDEGSKESKLTQVDIEINAGSADIAHADKIFEALNAIYNKEHSCFLNLSITGRLGWQAKNKPDCNSAEIFAADKTEMALKSKAGTPEAISLCH